jgi:hypothetical protein
MTQVGSFVDTFGSLKFTQNEVAGYVIDVLTGKLAPRQYKESKKWYLDLGPIGIGGDELSNYNTEELARLIIETLEPYVTEEKFDPPTDSADQFRELTKGAYDFSNPDTITIYGITFKEPGIRNSFFKKLLELEEQAFQKHGPNAFKLPKEGTAAHESGHVVVGHSLGYRIKYARLIEEPPGSWNGVTCYDFGQNPTAELLLSRARMLYAGQAAETLIKPKFQSPAVSSIKELMVSQTAINDKSRWNQEVHHDVLNRLIHNQEAFCRIAVILFKESHIGGSRLQKILSAVQVDPQKQIGPARDRRAEVMHAPLTEEGHADV